VGVQARASVHHRSRLSVTPWKTQCAQSVHTRLDVHPGNVKASTEQGTRSCAGLGACFGQCGAWSKPVAAVSWTCLWWACRLRAAATRPLALLFVSQTGLLSVYQANLTGPFGVKGTAAPEVKFLDRCKTHGSEGVLQGCVRRSRMRVWGAKMIRHRRSPAL